MAGRIKFMKFENIENIDNSSISVYCSQQRREKKEYDFFF